MSDEKQQYPKTVFHWNLKDRRLISDAKQESELGPDWFDSERKAKEELHRRFDAIKSVSELSKFDERPDLINAYYNRRARNTDGEELWKVVREYNRFYPKLIIQHPWAQRLVANLPPETASQTDQPHALEWLGTAREWGDMVLRLYKSKRIGASSDLDALQRASEHFIWRQRGGSLKSFNPRSVWQSLKNRDDYQDPRKPGPR